jgi:hypothetical protein
VPGDREGDNGQAQADDHPCDHPRPLMMVTAASASAPSPP